MNPPLGNAPVDFPQPGSIGGGSLPIANPGNILSLVPNGLVAVATFPPFLTTRVGHDAIAAIFKERPGTNPGDDPGLEPGHELISVGQPQLINRRSKAPSLIDRFLKNLRCLRPRLSAKFGRRPPVHSTSHNYGKRDTGYAGYEFCEQEDCGTVEDCFDSCQPCPRYGVIVKITWFPSVNAQAQSYGYGNIDRQAIEGFLSSAPPDCRCT